MKIVPKDWSDYQHYKDRKPQWIKLHRDLLNDYSYSLVRIGTKATLPLLWLLSCEYEDGVIDATLEEISFRIHIDANTVQKALDEIFIAGWYSLVQNGTDCYPREEKRREDIARAKEYKKDKDFSLDRITFIDDIGEEYLKALEAFLNEYIDDLSLRRVNAKSPIGEPMSYEGFLIALRSAGKKYKNYVATYKNWERRRTR